MKSTLFRYVTLAFFLFCFVLSTPPVHADEASNLRQEINSLEKELSRLIDNNASSRKIRQVRIQLRDKKQLLTYIAKSQKASLDSFFDLSDIISDAYKKAGASGYVDLLNERFKGVEVRLTGAVATDLSYYGYRTMVDLKITSKNYRFVFLYNDVEKYFWLPHYDMEGSDNIDQHGPKGYRYLGRGGNAYLLSGGNVYSMVFGAVKLGDPLRKYDSGKIENYTVSANGTRRQITISGIITKFSKIKDVIPQYYSEKSATIKGDHLDYILIDDWVIEKEKNHKTLK